MTCSVILVWLHPTETFLGEVYIQDTCGKEDDHHESYETQASGVAWQQRFAVKQLLPVQQQAQGLLDSTMPQLS